MNQYERDRHVPDFQTLKRIASALECPVLYFYAEDDDLAEIILHLGRMDDGARSTVLAELRKSTFRG